jgi:hypothetical protein
MSSIKVEFQGNIDTSQLIAGNAVGINPTPLIAGSAEILGKITEKIDPIPPAPPIVSNLVLSYSCRCTSWQGHYILIFNYKTNAWERFDYQTISQAISNHNETITNPSSYVSPDRKIQLELYSWSNRAWFLYFDLFKLTADGKELFCKDVTFTFGSMPKGNLTSLNAVDRNELLFASGQNGSAQELLFQLFFNIE